MTNQKLCRCPWAVGDEYFEYHDKEWGVPVHDDRLLFEFLIFEGAQAGLSWITILKKRDAYRKVFDNFNPVDVAEYGESKIENLMTNAGIIRNRLKIKAAIQNAKAFLRVQKEFGSFDEYIWKFVGGETIQNGWDTMENVPCLTPESEKMSKDLRKRGFNFVGPKICYAFMQATGMVNDHPVSCFRHRELRSLYNG